MIFFSGFGFKNEKILFKEYLENKEFNISGFSYGAQKALSEALKYVKDSKRVNKLQLISPAFFNSLPKAKKLKEIDNFLKNKELYMNFFYKKAAYPYKEDISIFKKEPSFADLKELLFFRWREEDLKFLNESGVEIEVFIGEFDKIIDIKEVESFFKPYSTIYKIKGVGHLLR